jgi:hypothetical protein
LALGDDLQPNISSLSPQHFDLRLSFVQRLCHLDVWMIELNVTCQKKRTKCKYEFAIGLAAQVENERSFHLTEEGILCASQANLLIANSMISTAQPHK